METFDRIVSETSLEISNRKLESMLRVTFSPKREFVCRHCSLRPTYCLGSLAEWHRCRYALRIDGGRISFPSDLAVAKQTGEKNEPLLNEMEQLVIKTLQRIRSLTSHESKISS
jgi:hypothetical protein